MLIKMCLSHKILRLYNFVKGLKIMVRQRKEKGEFYKSTKIGGNHI